MIGKPVNKSVIANNESQKDEKANNTTKHIKFFKNGQLSNLLKSKESFSKQNIHASEDLLVLLDPKEKDNLLNKSMNVSFSKPNLRHSLKFKAINLSYCETKPFHCHSALGKSYANLRAIKKASVSSQIETELSSNAFLKPGQGSGYYKKDLINKIELSLEGAENFIAEDKNSKANFKQLQKENSNLRSQFKNLNSLLTGLLQCKNLENFYEEKNKNDEKVKENVKKMGEVVDEKRLNFFRLEYGKFQKRIQEVKDPDYYTDLKATCSNLDKYIRKLRNKSASFAANQNLGNYVKTTIYI